MDLIAQRLRTHRAVQNGCPCRKNRLGIQRAFTLIELLVVIAIIGILIGLLLPAVQQVRESGRRVSCLNNVKQMTLAMQMYLDVKRRYPSGYEFPSQTMWSCHILPYLDHGNVYETIDINGPWTTDGSANEAACSLYIPVYRCPSAAVYEHAPAGEDQGIENRVPSSYLACASGLLNREAGALPYVGMPESDGIFYRNSKTRPRDITDGLAQTMMIGEAIFDYEVWGIDDHGGNEVVDHWYIGTEQFFPEYAEHMPDISTEASEALTSTACQINAWKFEGLHINDKEFSTGSRHPQGANVSFADGHCIFISESIDPEVWSAIGSRASGETNTKID